jgi:hypothetical protein
MIRQASILLLTLGIGACTHSGAQPLPESVARLDFLLLERPASPLGDWLLVGCYEVTREEFGLPPNLGAVNLPVAMVSFHEANAWSQERGLRLPTLKEWQYLASDSGRSAAVAASAHNGLPLSLERPLPVGVFERGRTSLGAYDFFGNVREWVYEPDSDRYFACGGSYASRDASVSEWEQLELQGSDRAEDIGFRYVANASTYFQEQVIPHWKGMSTEQRAELALMINRWSPQSRAALAGRLQALDVPQDFSQMLSGS